MRACAFVCVFVCAYVCEYVLACVRVCVFVCERACARDLCFVTKICLLCKHTFLLIVVQFATLFDRAIECSTVH